MATNQKQNYEAILQKYGGRTTPTIPKGGSANTGFPTGAPPQQNKSFFEKLASFGQGAQDFSVGFAKGAVKTVKNAADMGEAGLDFIADRIVGENQVYQGKATDIIPEDAYTPKNKAEKAGMFAEQVAEFAIPATKVTKATKALNIVQKTIARALTSGGVAAVQEGKVGKDAAIAAGVETAIPVVGKVIKPVASLVGRLFRGLGSGLSGSGQRVIEQIHNNPTIAKEVSARLSKGEGRQILTENSKAIVEGVSTIRKEARNAYRQGIEVLKETDIDPKLFRSNTQSFLDRYGSIVKEGKRTLQNVEFDDPRNLKKASDLIDKLSKVDLNGKSLNSLADKIEKSAFKTAVSDERLAFNAFVKELSKTLDDSINASTPRLKEINSAFSKDMQLVEAIEDIFGKVKFKNLSEIQKVSQKLETLFSKKGLSPEYIDDFFKRTGIDSDAFKTTEAVRQTVEKVSGPNSKGLGLGELIQQVTSSVITPKAVADFATFTGTSKEVAKALLERIQPLSPAAKGVIIKLFTGVDESSDE